jgi:hypothetical protein
VKSLKRNKIIGDMECKNCTHYIKTEDEYNCLWFDTSISKVYPGWEEKFRRGELKFKDCGFALIE